MDDVNNDILDVAKEAGVNAAPLFDLSGGAGVLPENWPVANGYCGYAGGLSPENVQGQLELIEQVAGDGPIWIDVETHVRSEDDKIFDLDKVRAFIENVLPWVMTE
jgi:phosphoribosylanthranilate isomerase